HFYIQLINETQSHFHPSDPTKFAFLEKRRFLKEKASVSDKPARKIMSQYIHQLTSQEEIAISPSDDADRQAINRVKNKSQTKYSEPDSLQNINIPEELKYTISSNDLFLIHDSGEDDLDRIDHDPLSVRCDFEVAFINAVELVFSNTRVYCCYFHLNLSIWRKIQNLDLEAANNVIDGEHRKLIKRGRGVKYTIVPAKPRYEIKLWSIHERIMEGIPRTTNYVESWHNAFGNMLKKHPNFYSLIDSLRSENKKSEYNLLKAQTGPMPTKKSVGLAIDERVREVLSEYKKNDYESFFDKLSLILNF
ncbi:unnamed protein product, partial [Brachionus calyciflorus]